MTIDQGELSGASHIGLRLQQIRKERRLRLADVARDIVSVGYLSMIEQGQRTPSASVLTALAARLDVDQAVLESGSFASARLGDVLGLQDALWQHLTGHHEEAVRRYRALLQRGSTVAGEATRGLARALLRSGSPADALAVVRRRAATLIPEGDWATEASNHLIVGLSLLHLGDLTAAHQSLQAAVDVAGRSAAGSDLHASSLVYLGRCQLRRGMVAQAVASFEEFLAHPGSLTPFQSLEGTARHHWAMANEQMAKQDLVGAIRTRERAIALQSLVAAARVKLRMALECAGYLLRVKTPAALAMAAQAAHRLRSLTTDSVDARFASDLMLVSAEIELAMHSPQEALVYVDAACCDRAADIAWASMIRALAHEALSNPDMAKEEADRTRAGIGSPRFVGRGSDQMTEPWEVLAALYRRLGEEELAWECMRKASIGAGVHSSLFPHRASEVARGLTAPTFV